MTYGFHPEARLEFRDAAAFYESRRPGLGKVFTDEVEATIHRITATPHKWRVILEGVRQCRTRTFPYAVLYSVESDFVLVVAVMHFRRKPGYWHERIPGR